MNRDMTLAAQCFTASNPPRSVSMIDFPLLSMLKRSRVCDGTVAFKENSSHLKIEAYFLEFNDQIGWSFLHRIGPITTEIKHSFLEPGWSLSL